MALSDRIIQEMVNNGRKIEIAGFGDKTLGPLKMLPGTWKNTEELNGFGFNMMALPFAGNQNGGYRILMNQYNEELHFSLVDKGVQNRGSDGRTIADQTIVALDYDQKIVQITAEDFPESGETEKFDGEAIHKEPGLWLYMTDRNTDINQTTADINIARLGSIPHGNSFIAVGHAPDETSSDFPGGLIPNVNGVVVGGGENLDEVDLEPTYFAPYKHFHETPFLGGKPIPGFNGFDPVNTTELLHHALTILPGEVKKTRVLHVDSTFDHAGIKSIRHAGVLNIPFLMKQAEATAMNSTFLIYEIEDAITGQTRHFMQYVQNIILDFINRPDGHPGRARWPHVSINTMERVSDTDLEQVKNSMLSKKVN